MAVVLCLHRPSASGDLACLAPGGRRSPGSDDAFASRYSFARSLAEQGTIAAGSVDPASPLKTPPAEKCAVPVRLGRSITTKLSTGRNPKKGSTVSCVTVKSTLVPAWFVQADPANPDGPGMPEPCPRNALHLSGLGILKFRPTKPPSEAKAMQRSAARATPAPPSVKAASTAAAAARPESRWTIRKSGVFMVSIPSLFAAWRRFGVSPPGGSRGAVGCFVSLPGRSSRDEHWFTPRRRFARCYRGLPRV